jgi:hypothetical protein
MPWTIVSSNPTFVDDPSSCPECAGAPAAVPGVGSGQCQTCGAILVSDDPPPGEVFILKLIPVNAELTPMPSRQRRTLEIRWGERRQADGTFAKVYRAINKQTDQYIEKIVRADGSVFHRDEPLSQHRGHGSAKPRRMTTNPE